MQPLSPEILALPAKVEMTIGEWNTVMALLAEHPFKIVAPLIGKIQQQGQAALPANGPLIASEADHVPN